MLHMKKLMQSFKIITALTVLLFSGGVFSQSYCYLDEEGPHCYEACNSQTLECNESENRIIEGTTVDVIYVSDPEQECKGDAGSASTLDGVCEQDSSISDFVTNLNSTTPIAGDTNPLDNEDFGFEQCEISTGVVGAMGQNCFFGDNAAAQCDAGYELALNGGQSGRSPTGSCTSGQCGGNANYCYQYEQQETFDDVRCFVGLSQTAFQDANLLCLSELRQYVGQENANCNSDRISGFSSNSNVEQVCGGALSTIATEFLGELPLRTQCGVPSTASFNLTFEGVKYCFDPRGLRKRTQREIDAINAQLSDELREQAAERERQRQDFLRGEAAKRAQTNFGGSGLVPNCTGNACGWVELITLINGLIQYLIVLSTFFILAVFVYAGYKITTARGNPTAISDARKMLITSVLGFVLVLTAWLIVATVLKLTVNQNKIDRSLQIIDQQDLGNVNTDLNNILR